MNYPFKQCITAGRFARCFSFSAGFAIQRRAAELTQSSHRRQQDVLCPEIPMCHTDTTHTAQPSKLSVHQEKKKKTSRQNNSNGNIPRIVALANKHIHRTIKTRGCMVHILQIVS